MSVAHVRDTFNMCTFDIAPHRCTANLEALSIHIGKKVNCVLRHRRSISTSIDIERTIQYNHLVISIANENHALVNKCVSVSVCVCVCVCVCLCEFIVFKYMAPRQSP